MTGHHFLKISPSFDGLRMVSQSNHFSKRGKSSLWYLFPVVRQAKGGEEGFYNKFFSFLLIDMFALSGKRVLSE